MLDRETCNVNVIDGLDFGYLVDELGFAMPGMMQSRIEEVDLLECKTEVKLSDREKAELKTMFETMAARASKESVIRCMQDSKIKAKVASAYR